MSHRAHTGASAAPAMAWSSVAGRPRSLVAEPAGSRSLGRRAFLWTAIASALGAVLGEVVGHRWARRRARAVAALGGVRVAGASELAPGEATAVSAAELGLEALVVRLSAAQWVAFDRRCPHLGCPVLWSAEARRFECPCHAAAFDGRSGRVLSGPPRGGLTPLTVEERADGLWVRGAPAARERESA